MSKVYYLEESGINNPTIIDSIEKMNAFLTNFSKHGAADTEPREQMMEVLLNAISFREHKSIDWRIFRDITAEKYESIQIILNNAAWVFYLEVRHSVKSEDIEPCMRFITRGQYLLNP